MHRTLKRAAIRPPRGDATAQQRAFNWFPTEYNEERPHAALGGQTPAAHDHASPRPYPQGLPPQEYPGHFLVKTVTFPGLFFVNHTCL